MAREIPKESELIAFDGSASSGALEKPLQALKISSHVKAKAPGYDAQFLPHRSATRLHELADDLARTTMPSPTSRIVSVQQISVLYDGVKKKVKLREWDLPKKGEQVIYRLSVLDHATLQRFDRARNLISDELKGKISLARFNKLHPDSTTLYVGVSQDLPVRLEWHFGIKRPENYALHLSRWVPPKMRQTPIMLEYWSVTGLALTHDLATQALEDAMWTECAPLFGRQGPK